MPFHQIRANPRAGAAAPVRPPRLLFVWETFAAYHMDRCEACARYFAGRYEILGIEIASRSRVNHWERSGPGSNFTKLTLFPGVSAEEIGLWRYFSALLRAAVGARARYVFLCGYQYPPVFLAALGLKLLGRRVIVMQDSKFDDKPRRLAKEWLKAVLYRPYDAAFVGSERSAQYLRFLGFRRSRIFLGYDVVSMDRMLTLAAAEPAPGGVPHAERHFTVLARFAPEKNLSVALAAYALYRGEHGGTRELHLCGSGPLEEALRAQVARQGIAGIRFCGHLRQEDVAGVLASSLALILPSVEEPFGLVVNEALALGVPPILSENCGARDRLVRSAVNGYVVEPDNVAGYARFMRLLDRDEAEWRRLALNTRAFLPAADTEAFPPAAERIVAALSGEARAVAPAAHR